MGRKVWRRKQVLKAKELSAIEVGRLKTAGMWAVGGVAGLYLHISDRGARSWVLRAMVGSKRRDMGLGGYPDVTLAGARDKAREARSQIEAGNDPILLRKQAHSALLAQQATELTFEQAAHQYILAQSDAWRNAKHRQQWTTTLASYAYPVIGRMLVRDVAQAHMLAVLEPIWRTKTETAKRLRGRIESVLDWATVRGHREGSNPARWRGHLDKLLPSPRKIAKVAHHEALPIDELPGFMRALRQREGMAARALEFAILTAARSGEVRGMTWAEVDLNQRLWIVPAGRMKANREHRVTLSDAAVALLQTLPRLEGSEFVFFAPRGGQLSDMTLTAVLRRMQVAVTAHGFRSTFRDWAAERTNYPRDLVEMAMSHAIESKVEAAYRRGDMLEKRRKLMAAWADFCNRPTGSADVVAIGRKKAAA